MPKDLRPRVNQVEYDYLKFLRGKTNLKSTLQKWVILPDVHRPFHDKELWSKVLKLLVEMRPYLNGLVIAGDYLDLFALGSYNADSVELLKYADLSEEYADGLQGLNEIKEALGPKYKDVEKVFIYGNHEDRYFREMAKGDNSKYGSALQNPKDALRLDKLGYTVFEDWKDDYYTIGEHLDVFHGVFTNQHAAHKHLKQSGRSCMFGHTHRIQSFREGDKAGFNIGTLCDLKSVGFKYMPRLQRQIWANGFAIVDIDRNGYFYVQQVTCFDGGFVANGKLY